MLTSAESKLLHALKNRSGREKHGAFVVEGVRVAEEALAANFDLKFAAVSTSLEDTDRGRALLQALAARTTVRRVPHLRDIAETETPQGVVLVANTPNTSLDDVVLHQRALVLVLDAVQDPGNLGTLIRSADAFAAAAVIALSGTVDFWNSKVIRSAAGAAFHLPLISAGDDVVWSWLDNNNFTVCGADMGGEPVAAADVRGGVALVAGNEGNGLREQTRAKVAKVLAIPMPGDAESLNVAVATGILLYELSKRI